MPGSPLISRLYENLFVLLRLVLRPKELSCEETKTVLCIQRYWSGAKMYAYKFNPPEGGLFPAYYVLLTLCYEQHILKDYNFEIFENYYLLAWTIAFATVNLIWLSCLYS